MKEWGGSIAKRGAHVIILVGPVAKLKWDHPHAKDGFLCPARYDESSQNQKSFPRRYTCISKKVHSSKQYTTFDGLFEGGAVRFLEAACHMNDMFLRVVLCCVMSCALSAAMAV